MRNAAPRRRSRTVLLLAAVVLGLAVGVGLDIARRGGLEAWLAGDPAAPAGPSLPPYVASGRTVDVDGRNVYLDCRGAGSPTVILEAGFAASAGSWAWLLEDTARTTRVCAWDRPGLERSESRGRHTGLDVAADLRAALAGAGERGPYVVVAHSLGGVHALLFASLFASPEPSATPAATDEAVAGFVQLDSFEPLVWMADDPGLDPVIRDQHRKVLAETGAMIESFEGLAWDATLAELRALEPTPIETLLLPVTMAGKFGDQSQPTPAALAASWYRVVGEHYPNGRVEEVANSGHVIHFDRPELVTARVREMVLAVRTR